jgi:hypothetical protein
MTECEPEGPRPTPSLLVVNARAWTGDRRRPWVDAVLARDGCIVALGSSAELRKRAGKGTVVVDAGGRVVLSPIGDHALARGAPAHLRILEGSATEPPTVVPANIVFALQDGRIVMDRGLLAPRTCG